MISPSSSASADERLMASAALDAAEEQLQTLTASYAGTFVSVERRSADYQAHLQQLLVDIENVQAQASTSLHVLEQDGSKEDETLTALAERHRIRRRTLLQHSSLLELLELPNIMDACVRSNLYEESLQIAAFANTLARRHSTDGGQFTSATSTATASTGTGTGTSTSTSTAGTSLLSNETNENEKATSTKASANVVVQQVIRQIRSRQSDLRRHLIGRLRMSVTMPECLEVVTAVRRLNAIDLENLSSTVNITTSGNSTGSNNLEQQHSAMEFRLQIAFLEARDVWLDSKFNSSQLRHGSLDPQEETVLDAIERYRTRMFEVMTQFNAIFRAQHAAASSTQLLTLWTSRRVHSFQKLLRSEMTVRSQQQQLPDAAAIRDAVEASVFFGTSLGRLGADFTSQLVAIFEPALLQIITHYWMEGVAQFRETLSVCREAGVASPLTADVSTGENRDTNEPESSQADMTLDGPQLPPKKLLALPPLARIVNAVLAGLNELRRCLLPGIFPSLRRYLEEHVLKAIDTELLTNERAVLVPGLRGEAAALRAVATEMQAAYRAIVEPYLRGSLEAAIGNSSAAARHHQVLRDNMSQRNIQPSLENEGDKTETIHVDADRVDPSIEVDAEASDSKETIERPNTIPEEANHLANNISE